MIRTDKRARYEALTWREAEGREVDFLLSIYRERSGEAAVSALDIGCGPGDYTRLLAGRGLRVIGLESDSGMLELARKTSPESGLGITWQYGDLRHFAVEESVDLAICLRGRASQLLSNEDLTRHFNAVANALSPSGLYIMELPHPRENPLNNSIVQRIRAEREGIVVERSWPEGNIERDLVGGVFSTEEELRIEDNGQLLVQRTAVARRAFSPQDILLVAMHSESMRLVSFYGAFDSEQPLDDSATAQSLIAVLQKVELPLSYLSPKLEMRPSAEKGDGFGLFAREGIKQDELLIAYGGHVIERDQLPILSKDAHRFSLQIEEDLFLTSIGTQADYVNHSCAANAGMYGATMLAAMRDIEPEEEIGWDYAMSDGSPYDEFECTCGAQDCRRKVSGNDWQIPALWEQYAGYFSPYLQRRIDRLRREQERGNDG